MGLANALAPVAWSSSPHVHETQDAGSLRQDHRLLTHFGHGEL